MKRPPYETGVLKLYQQTCIDLGYLRDADIGLLRKANRVVSAQDIMRENRDLARWNFTPDQIRKSKQLMEAIKGPSPHNLEGRLEKAETIAFEVGLIIGQSVYDIASAPNARTLRERLETTNFTIAAYVIEGTYLESIRRLADTARRLESGDNVIQL